jgi:aminoglycoside phosphotransferase (APT) family kinase protein
MAEVGLTAEQARRLLVPLGDVAIVEIETIATTNHVFRVLTAKHGTYYIKLHTARWYADQPDTFFVVNRECAVHDLLRIRGMPLPYLAWGEYTRSAVPRSAYICGELPGRPVPEAMRSHPYAADAIVYALGRYMRRLHAIQFSNPGLIEPAHARFCRAVGRIPPVEAWDGAPLHHAAHMQREALDLVCRAAERGHLRDDVASELQERLAGMVALLEPDYHPPRFTVGNCHAWHFHVQHEPEGWAVLGFYDFEAASAGDPTIDLIELEVTLTPALGSSGWRAPFLDAYGRWPALEGYKLRLYYYLLHELFKAQSRVVPDRAWLDAHWMDMIQAGEWDELVWYPPGHFTGEEF